MASLQHSRHAIRNFLKLKKFCCIWGKLAEGTNEKLPRDVPRGHLAVMVGRGGKRFIIRADYLNHPIFRELLDKAFEEYGHNKDGPLVLPCDEYLLHDIVHSLTSTGTMFSQVIEKLVRAVSVGLKGAFYA